MVVSSVPIYFAKVPHQPHATASSVSFIVGGCLEVRQARNPMVEDASSPWEADSHRGKWFNCVKWLGAFSRAPISEKCVVFLCQMTYFRRIQRTICMHISWKCSGHQLEITEENGNLRKLRENIENSRNLNEINRHSLKLTDINGN